jgi:hypothetical protein
LLLASITSHVLLACHRSSLIAALGRSAEPLVADEAAGRMLWQASCEATLPYTLRREGE